MRNIRVSIACTAFLLLMFGIVVVYSASAIYAGQVYDDQAFFLKRQVIMMAAGAILTFLVMLLDLDILRRYSRHILVITILLLLITLIPGLGKEAGGANRWIGFRFFNIQPSEIAKIALLIYLADFIDRRSSRITNFFSGYLPPLIVIGTVMLLILAEPDLGTAMTAGVVGFLLLFVSGASLRHMMITALASLPFIYYLLFSVPYRRKRMLAFINPWLDEKGTGFQIVQSFIALGSGGIFGVGLGQSKQKLFYLPASHTDFIFSIIGEELGFLGLISVLILFFVLIWQGLRAAFKTEDLFRKNLIFGIVFMIAFEVIVNIGVSTGSLPTKGLPLPFISYGGTSLVMHMVGIGLLLNASREE